MGLGFAVAHTGFVMQNEKSESILIQCRNLDETLVFFTGKLGFRLEMISPADAPTLAVISGHGKILHLKETDEIADFVLNDPPKEFTENTDEFVLTRFDKKSLWHRGRAGMEYRDLIPDRLGGRFIASHIRIKKGGEVPDYVHFHEIRFQMIYCLAGWAKLVYEDQGEPFKMHSGGCVLQPSEIRHRVLECSDNFEVLEIASPAVHETFAEYEITLPNENFAPERIFSGQKFVHHSAENDVWQASEVEGLQKSNTGISDATDGLADVSKLTAVSDFEFSLNHSDEFLFFFILDGNLKLSDRDGLNYSLTKNDCFVLPARTEYFLEGEKGAKMLRVCVQKK